MRLREQAIANHSASGSSETLPTWLTNGPPLRPEPYQDEEMTDVSVDMTANGFDASESFTLGRSIPEEHVPMADPGLDRPPSSVGRLLMAASFYKLTLGGSFSPPLRSTP